jgi:drug/metabolite transporter (DMT)-like permease
MSEDMLIKSRTLPFGIGSALLAALLFGVSTPFAKVLLGEASPVLLAGLFYLGSGLGLTIIFVIWRRKLRTEAPLSKKDIPWLTGAVFFGGILGPALLMVGLSSTPASAASLLLNLESVFTAFLAWFIFRENFDIRIALGMALILAGGALLTFQGEFEATPSLGTLAIVGASLCWGIDNNLTQKVSASDPIQIAAIKGIVAGTVNTIVAIRLGATVPAVTGIASALVVGFLGYGISLVMFVLALRRIGTARTGAYFSTAPFVGALTSVLLLREPISISVLGGGVLMGFGVWLHITERHHHEHTHEHIVHDHQHVHDEHHHHEHAVEINATQSHTHLHEHETLAHSHHHYPDIHHRHPH